MPSTTYCELSEIHLLVDKFINKRLPVDEWTHVAHLTVGLWFVSNYSLEEATRKLPDCIYTYNESVGTENSDTGGYPETITQFWIWILNAYWQQIQGSFFFWKLVITCLLPLLRTEQSFLNFIQKS